MSTHSLSSEIALQHTVVETNKANVESELSSAIKKKKRQQGVKGEGSAKRKKRKLSGTEGALPDSTANTSSAPGLALTGETSSFAFLDAVVTAASQVSQDASVPLTRSAPKPGLDLFANASPEEMMSILQSLDTSKLDDILKDVGSSADAADINFGDPQTRLIASSSTSHRSNVSRARASRVAKSTAVRDGVGRRHRNPSEISPLIEFNNTNAAELLATRWLSSDELSELAKNEGALVFHAVLYRVADKQIAIVLKRGKFSSLEDEQLLDAIDKYQREKGVSEDRIYDYIFPKRGEKDTTFWTSIARAVPMRPVTAVYHHVRRIYHPLGMQGKWTATEDETLIDAVLELGQQWEKVSTRVGRTATDCRDRYRNKVKHQDKQTIGRWSVEEEEKLAEIVKELSTEKGKDSGHDIFWTVVADRMGHTRSRQQCRNKWTDALSKRVKAGGEEVQRWSALDAFILVAKVDSLCVQDDTEIDWKTLPDNHWNLWSPHILQRRWRTMKQGIKGYEGMTHDEIMDILREKKAYAPDKWSSPKATRSSNSKQYKSKQTISGSDDDGEGDDRMVDNH